MKAAIYIILMMGIAFGFWLMYQVVKYTQGEKIKAYLEHQLDIYRSEKHYQQTQKAIRLKKYRESQPIEVEVEDLGVRTWDLVSNTGERTPNQFVFEISNLPVKD